MPPNGVHNGHRLFPSRQPGGANTPRATWSSGGVSRTRCGRTRATTTSRSTRGPPRWWATPPSSCARAQGSLTSRGRAARGVPNVSRAGAAGPVPLAHIDSLPGQAAGPVALRVAQGRCQPSAPRATPRRQHHVARLVAGVAGRRRAVVDFLGCAVVGQKWQPQRLVPPRLCATPHRCPAL